MLDILRHSLSHRIILCPRHTTATLITIAPRSSRSQSRGEIVVNVRFSMNQYDVIAPLPRSRCAQHDCTTLYVTLNTELALRLHCAHCVCTTTTPITLRPSDAFTARMRRSSRLHCALTTLLLRLQYALITRLLRSPRSYRNLHAHQLLSNCRAVKKLIKINKKYSFQDKSFAIFYFDMKCILF